ncbi:hypothetical protein ACFHW1_05150 [Micromonospora sp. LOL_014]|uniref:hypothetical protein n=1 Tax=Micromonospora sp. LOL_014 TaxID=3345415 RepID=UPI003A83C356
MSRVVAPIDPDTPAGQAAADALSQALGEIYAGIARRRATAKGRPPSPQPKPPSPPPYAPRPPAAPQTPPPPAGPRTTQDAA